MIRIPAPGGKSKYHAQKTVIDDITFDSHQEARYYLYLKMCQKEGIVTGIECQPVFPLQDKFTKNGVKYQAINYVADFRVKYADGREEIIDVKGMETPVFKLKRKLFEAKYPALTLKVIGGKRK